MGRRSPRVLNLNRRLPPNRHSRGAPDRPSTRGPSRSRIRFPQSPFLPVGITRGPQLITPPSELKPPYPQAKLLAEEEATLTLRLTIDEEGRVVAVDPEGRADGVFLAAARRYLIGHWRYNPAMKDGHAVASSITISLRFQLDG